ncbi:MAG: hypothetical protein IPH21_18595 [Flavobacteriales bacterium]|nr:hypothetical protein [Flavobacteriales bacterium]
MNHCTTSAEASSHSGETVVKEVTCFTDGSNPMAYDRVKFPIDNYSSTMVLTG